MDRLKAWLALSMAHGTGPVLARRLLNFFGSPEKVFEVSEGDLLQVEGVGKKVAASLRKALDNPAVEKELKILDSEGVQMIPLDDPAYPVRLKDIPNPPVVLFVKGRLVGQEPLALGIVGSRTCTHYGKKMAEYFGEQLAHLGFTIVSGLAKGIDSYAHLGALRVAEGRVIGVLGSGLGNVYPKENRELYRQVQDHGALVTEYPFHLPPDTSTFPARNRIIAGISLGVVVVEAPEKSGSLITADMALEYSREVFAVPGRADSEFCRGSNRLINQGAKLTMTVQDIVEDLESQLRTLASEGSSNAWMADVLKGDPASLPGPAKPEPPPPAPTPEPARPLDPAEQQLWELLLGGPLHIDTLAERAGLPVRQVSQALMTLELEGLCTQLAGKMFMRKG